MPLDSDWITCFTSAEQNFRHECPVTQLATAIRILDGRDARKQAKELAEESLIAKARAFDQQYVQTQKPIEKPRAVQHAPSPFDDLIDADVEPLNPNLWST